MIGTQPVAAAVCLVDREHRGRHDEDLEEQGRRRPDAAPRVHGQGVGQRSADDRRRRPAPPSPTSRRRIATPTRISRAPRVYDVCQPCGDPAGEQGARGRAERDPDQAHGEQRTGREGDQPHAAAGRAAAPARRRGSGRPSTVPTARPAPPRRTAPASPRPRPACGRPGTPRPPPRRPRRPRRPAPASRTRRPGATGCCAGARRPTAPRPRTSARRRRRPAGPRRARGGGRRPRRRPGRGSRPRRSRRAPPRPGAGP